jgi:hypothetical protein
MTPSVLSISGLATTRLRSDSSGVFGLSLGVIIPKMNLEFVLARECKDAVRTGQPFTG